MGFVFGEVDAAGKVWNGTEWENAQGNQKEQTLLASASRTALTSSPAFTNGSCRGFLLRLSASLIGTGTLALNVFGQGANLYTFPAMSTSTQVVVVYPGLVTESIAVNVKHHNGVAPYSMFARVIPSDASAWTYALYVSLLR